MPTTIGSLVVFIAFLTPGFVYLARRETRFPSKRYSTLRETATVVSASLLFNMIVVGVFAVIRYLWPDITPDVGAIVRDAQPYFQDHYASILLWSGTLFVASVSLAALWAVPPRWIHKLVGWAAPERWRGSLQDWSEKRQGNPIIPKSNWSLAFRDDQEQCVYLGLRLKDGTYLYGPLAAFNPQFEENDERSLMLSRPVQIRTSSSENDALEDYEADAVIVSAGQIKTVSVHRIPTRLLLGDTLGKSSPLPQGDRQKRGKVPPARNTPRSSGPFDRNHQGKGLAGSGSV